MLSCLGVLGRGKSDIFSQDKETLSQEAARIAVQQFIEKEVKKILTAPKKIYKGILLSVCKRLLLKLRGGGNLSTFDLKNLGTP